MAWRGVVRVEPLLQSTRIRSQASGSERKMNPNSSAEGISRVPNECELRRSLARLKNAGLRDDAADEGYFEMAHTSLQVISVL